MPNSKEQPLLNNPHTNTTKLSHTTKVIGCAGSLAAVLFTIGAVAILLSNKKNTPLPTATPAPSVPPVTVAPVPPVTATPFSSNLTDSVIFSVNVTVEQKDSLGNYSDTQSESCTKILAETGRPGDQTFNNIAWAVVSGLYPDCTKKESCTVPSAIIPCNETPAIGITTGPADCASSASSFSEDSSSVSNSSGVCIDIGQLPCVIDPTEAVFKKVFEACQQVQKGNTSKVCGENEEKPFFNSTVSFGDSKDYTRISTKGFFSCSAAKKKLQSKHAHGIPRRSMNFR